MNVENPYASPASIAEQCKPESRLLRQVAILSWQLPLGGFLVGLTGAIFWDWAPILGGVGFLVFLFGVLAGFMLSIISLIASWKYRGLLVPAFAGLICTTVVVLPVVALLAIDFARISAQQEATQYRDQFEIEIEGDQAE